MLNYLTSDSTQNLYPGMYWHFSNHSTQYHVSTLASIQEIGRDGGGLPTTTFTYADQMHLTEVNNGYNGKVELIYETTPWPAAGTSVDDYGYNIARQGYSGDYFGNPPQYKAWNFTLLPNFSGNTYFMLPPGKVVWMEMQEWSRDP